LLVTASAVDNVITFTKGDGSTFPVTVNTGSAAAAFPYTGSAIISGSLGVTGSISVTSGSFSGSVITNLTDVSQGSILGYASSIAPGATVHNYVNGEGMKAFTNYNGQITNRVAFAFTAPTVTSRRLRIDTVRAFAGVITDMSGGVGVTSTYTANLIRNVGGAGNTAAVGIGTTFLTLVA
jgi:hypothetical protein